MGTFATVSRCYRLASGVLGLALVISAGGVGADLFGTVLILWALW